MNSGYAHVKMGPGSSNIRYQNVDVREPGPDEVLLELIYAGICHTDLNMINGKYESSVGYSPLYPLVLGHEFTARVLQIGKNVENLQPGARVVSGCHITCGTCRWCDQGRSMLCIERQVIGLDTDGCWAEKFVMPSRNLVELPDTVSDRLAAIAEPFAVGAHAVDLAQVKQGECVAVVGPGPVGLLTLGALEGHSVVVIGRREDARHEDLARSLGAEAFHTFADLEGERGIFDVIIETAGSADAVTQSLSLLGPGGRLVCVGLPNEPAHLDTAQLAWEEKTVIGSRAYDISTWKSIPQRLGQVPKLEEVVTDVLPLTDVNQARKLLEAREAVKVLLRPERSTL